MECKLLLFSIFVLCFNLAVSYPEVEDEFKLGAQQLTELSKTVRRLPQRPQNVHNGSYRPRGGNLPQDFQEGPSEQWQRSQISPQQRHSNFMKPQIANSIPQNDYQETPPQVPYDQRSPRQRYNNYERSQNVYNAPQSFEEIAPEVPPQERKISQQETISSRQSTVPTEGWWSSQKLHQQNQLFERPYTSNNFVNNYPEPYVDQRRNYRNYNYAYPQYQMPTPIISNPVQDYNNYRQEWPLQNDYHHMSIPSPGGYPQWREPGYPNSSPTGPQYNIEPSIHTNENNEPAYPVYPPALDNGSAMIVEPISDLSEPEYQNDHIQIVPSQQPLKDHSKSRKGYIIVHANGTYEHVDNLAGIVVGDFNDTHIESKDIPDHILAIVEVDDDISDMENEKKNEIPFDTGISKIPQDIDWNPNYQDYPGTPQTFKNSNALLTEPHEPVPDIHTTTEDTNMDYFKPEYIIPIQSTTENSIDNTTDTALPTTEANESIEETTNIFDSLYTLDTTDIPKRVQNGTYGDFSRDDVDTSNITEPSEEGSNFDSNNQMYYVPGTMSLEVIPSPFSKTTVETDGHSTSIAYGDDYLINVTDDQAVVTPSTYTYDLPKDSEIENIVQIEIMNYPAGDQNVVNATTTYEGTNTPATRETDKLRNDLETDLADLKTVVDKPIVWFRPDDKFWDKVAKGEQSYDVVSIYDIRCEPRLVERHTTVHYYPNGTEIIDYVETLWDHAGDLNPKETKSNRVVRHPNV